MSIRIAAIGLSHNHVYNQVNALLAAGAELIWFHSDEPDRAAEFIQRFPQAKRARTIDEVLDDASIQLIASAPVPDERGPLGIRAMQHGKDYICAKPGFVTLEQLHDARRVQAETGHIFAVYYGERLGNPATVKAGELVHAGAIGRVVNTTGFGPHRLLGHVSRPDWSFDKARHGGILVDLASHQADQFLYFTGNTQAEIVASHVGNVRFPQFPQMDDFGDMTLRSPNATGYVRVDWLTPEGLATWGDVRLFLLGTEGTIELRKNIDIAGKGVGSYLYLVNQQGTQVIDCADTPLPYGAQLIHDVLNRTETAMSQAHCFLASELALIAQQQATVIRPA